MIKVEDFDLKYRKVRTDVYPKFSLFSIFHFFSIFRDTLARIRNFSTLTKGVPTGLTGDKDESGSYVDFLLQPKGTTGFTAYLRCPNNTPSKAKCTCKTKGKPGKPLERKMKCKKLTERKYAKKC